MQFAVPNFYWKETKRAEVSVGVAAALAGTKCVLFAAVDVFSQFNQFVAGLTVAGIAWWAVEAEIVAIEFVVVDKLIVVVVVCKAENVLVVDFCAIG